MKKGRTYAPLILLLADTASYVSHLEFCYVSEVLQRRIYKVFGDMQGVEVIADNMIIAGGTEEEHDRLLKNVMQGARKQNVKFNPKKI